jgi:hypothetical protein
MAFEVTPGVQGGTLDDTRFLDGWQHLYAIVMPVGILVGVILLKKLLH